MTGAPAPAGCDEDEGMSAGDVCRGWQDVQVSQHLHCTRLSPHSRHRTQPCVHRLAVQSLHTSAPADTPQRNVWHPCLCVELRSWNQMADGSEVRNSTAGRCQHSTRCRHAARDRLAAGLCGRVQSLTTQGQSNDTVLVACSLESFQSGE